VAQATVGELFVRDPARARAEAEMLPSINIDEVDLQWEMISKDTDFQKVRNLVATYLVTS